MNIRCCISDFLTNCFWYEAEKACMYSLKVQNFPNQYNTFFIYGSKIYYDIIIIKHTIKGTVWNMGKNCDVFSTFLCPFCQMRMAIYHKPFSKKYRIRTQEQILPKYFHSNIPLFVIWLLPPLHWWGGRIIFWHGVIDL